MDYPDGQMEPSGPYRKGEILPMSSGRVDVGRTAIGQALLLVTPLQMATVAQTIGNGGAADGAAAGREGRRSRRPHRRGAAAQGGRARDVAPRARRRWRR